MAERKTIVKGIECPRCRGTGRERMFPNMSCGGCYGKGVTQEELCPNCFHPMRSHTEFKNMGIVWCQSESSSGQFTCGCQASEKLARPICNVCGRECGNAYCLEIHLEESPNCREKFKLQYYD